jgi:Dyp-type peroxidase family
MGFKDGTANPGSEDAAALQEFVWASARESPGWMHGGSYMVVRRIEILLAGWDAISLHQQQDAVGRHKLSGAPLTGQREYDPIDLGAQRPGTPTSAWPARPTTTASASCAAATPIWMGSITRPVHPPAGSCSSAFSATPGRSSFPSSGAWNMTR